jgi:hypothetical protein
MLFPLTEPRARLSRRRATKAVLDVPDLAESPDHLPRRDPPEWLGLAGALAALTTTFYTTDDATTTALSTLAFPVYILYRGWLYPEQPGVVAS